MHSVEGCVKIVFDMGILVQICGRTFARPYKSTSCPKPILTRLQLYLRAFRSVPAGDWYIERPNSFITA